MVVWLRRLAWGVGAVLLLWAVLWLGLPALLKWQLPLRASEALGRPVTLGAVTFHPWNLDLTLDDLAIAAAPGAPGAAPSGPEPLLKIGRVHANLSAASLWRLAPVLEALEVDALRLRVARTAAGHYDIDDLIARFTPKPDAKPAAEPARFALYNVQLRDAQVRFDDRPVQRVHTVDALHLTLPFVSNLPAQVEIKVEPRLAFKLNGAPFDSGAQALPFAQTKSGDLTIAFTDLDLKPYLGYLPDSLPVRVAGGSVSADLHLNFVAPPNGAPVAALKGQLAAKDLAVADRAGAPLVGVQRLQLGLRELRPLAARTLAFERLRVEGLVLHATRDAAGRINLLQLAPPAATEAAPAPPGWKVSLEALELADARIDWNDAAVKPAAALRLDGLALSATQIRWPLTQPVPVKLKGTLRTQDNASAPALAEFSAEGPVTDHDAKLALGIDGVSLNAFAPYLAGTLVPALDGRLAAQAQVDWSGAADAPRLQLVIDQLALDDLRLREGSGRGALDAVALKRLVLADVKVDLLARSVALGRVALTQPVIALARDAKGRLNAQGWLVGGDAPAFASATKAPPAPAWQVRLDELTIDGGQLRFSDAAARPGGGEPLRVELAQLKVVLQHLTWHGERAVPPAELQLSARVAAPRAGPRDTGSLDYKGRLGVQPLLADGRVKIERFPVALFAPYVGDRARLALIRAQAGYTGSVAVKQQPAGLDIAAAGDVLLGDVHVATLPEPGSRASLANTDELLSWQALALKGVKVSMKPRARPGIEIGEAALNDFYARLVVTEQGRLNLQDVAGAPDDAASAPPAAAPAPPPSPASAAASAPAGGEPLPIDIRVGATKITNGRVDFTDHFVRPNYSAALTELNGALGAFASGSREMATLALRGRAEGTALLEISGQLNPSVKPLALDIRAKATDLELAPLSPYAGKYAGYAIERGKLSMDVAYKIDADGKLNASNQVILNQLTFGDKIESKDATKLPVRLAVALLKDRNGVIDINLPVSGSINDPQFSVGGIIVKVIINLLTRALTAPFALLAGGGGGDDLSLVEFKPGTAQIAPAGLAAVDKVAKALTERPGLKMTVTGAADPASERDAFQAAALDNRLAAEQRREALRAGTAAPAAGSAPSAPAALAGDERARLLKQVYKDTELPDKPRNALGFAKDLPGPEMEALLKARAPVTTEAMRELALQRGIAVRDALIAKGLPSERLFLAAPKLRAA
ncbi:MAG TPA: DUF748 domain-containing protein, partial [Burkholderiaceae bacterium]|nr:DUF748 domain-containing protein [Burkholderiaceae bacterium]